MTEPVQTPETPEGEPTTTQPRRTRRTVAVGVAAGVVALLAGGGAFAYTQLSGGGPQPADVMPSTMQAYARLDLDPSAGQKVALFKLLRKIPEARKEFGDADELDLRQEIFADIAEDSCPDLDYGQDIEPWLGKRIGVGANLAEEQFLVAAQVTDEKKARTGIDALADCSGTEIGLAFVDGYALMSDSQKTVDDAVDATAEKSLGDDADFAADMEALGEQGIASAWFDGKAAAEALADLPGAEAAELGDVEQLEKLGGVSAAVRVDGSAIELAGLAENADSVTTKPAPIGELPADTVFGLAFSGAGPALTENYDKIKDAFTEGFESATAATPTAEPIDPDVLADMDPATRDLYEQYAQDAQQPPSVDDFIEQFETATGLTVPDDVATALGDTFTLSVGRANLDRVSELAGPEDLSSLDLAIRTQTDPARAKATLDKLARLAEREGGVPLIVEETDDGAVLATNEKAAKALLSGGKLGDESAFSDVMPFGDDTFYGAYVDIAAIVDAIGESDLSDGDREDLEQVEALRSAGISAGKADDERVGFSIRVSFKD